MYSPKMHLDASGYENNTCYPIAGVNQALHWYSKIRGVSLEDLHIKGRILDVGCGPGAVTRVLYKYIDEKADFEACDISQNVIETASKNSDIDAKFFTLDATKKIPDNLEGSYDFIFSNFVLHWIQDHRSILKNVSSMLKQNGQCLICFFCNHPVFASYRETAKIPKWAPFMQDVEEFVTPYQDDEDADVKFKQIMLENGFKKADVVKAEIDFKYAGRVYTYENYKNILINIDPFLLRLEESSRAQYVEDLWKIFIKNNAFKTPLEVGAELDQEVEGTGELIFALGTK